MSSCPTCGSAAELRTESLEPALAGQRCGQCGGVWIRLSDYAEWLERGSTEAAGSDDAGSTEIREGPFLRRCPDCRYILGRYRVGHDVPFTIDRCHNCRGVWLDALEWEALRRRKLHARLHQIFTEDWQASVRRNFARARDEASHRRLLGDADNERVNELRAWIRSHPRRDLVLAVLMEEDTGKPER